MGVCSFTHATRRVSGALESPRRSKVGIQKPSNPVPTGTTQLLASCDANRSHWIGCLFTSAKYGKAKDKPDVIVGNTIQAMQMLLELVSQNEGVTSIRMCKINSGRFAVPWQDTADALTSIELQAHWRTSVEVWEP